SPSVRLQRLLLSFPTRRSSDLQVAIGCRSNIAGDTAQDALQSLCPLIAHDDGVGVELFSLLNQYFRGLALSSECLNLQLWPGIAQDSGHRLGGLLCSACLAISEALVGFRGLIGHVAALRGLHSYCRADAVSGEYIELGIEACGKFRGFLSGCKRGLA